MIDIDNYQDRDCTPHIISRDVELGRTCKGAFPETIPELSISHSNSSITSCNNKSCIRAANERHLASPTFRIMVTIGEIINTILKPLQQAHEQKQRAVDTFGKLIEAAHHIDVIEGGPDAKIS